MKGLNFRVGAGVSGSQDEIHLSGHKNDAPVEYDNTRSIYGLVVDGRVYVPLTNDVRMALGLGGGPAQYVNSSDSLEAVSGLLTGHADVNFGKWVELSADGQYFWPVEAENAKGLTALVDHTKLDSSLSVHFGELVRSGADPIVSVGYRFDNDAAAYKDNAGKAQDETTHLGLIAIGIQLR